MLFAWIDSSDCYGTILEIGYAKALNKVVVVGVSESFKNDAREMWLAFEGCYCVYGNSPLEAWDQFWDCVAFEDESPDLSVGSKSTLGPAVDALLESLREADPGDFQQIYDAAMAIADITSRGTIPLAIAVSRSRKGATDGTHAG
jgi:hypothetical protein